MKKVSVIDIQEKKLLEQKISMIAAYDSISGYIADKANIDLVLVGDSVGMVLLGETSTVPITMEQMIYHTRATVSTCKSPLVIGDLPFMSFQVSKEEAIKNAGRLMKEGLADAVKIEGGTEFAETAKAIVDSGIPCMGHIGLTPQTISKLGGYRVQGRTTDAAAKLLEDALALEAAGCFAILLECVPSEAARIITEKCQIPIIGIGAGPYVDGQSLVMHDLLGLLDRQLPRFVKKYINGLELMIETVEEWVNDCKIGVFPAKEHCYTMKDEN